MSEQFFPYVRDDRFRLLLLPLGVTRRDGVTVTDELVQATFGHFSMTTSRSNVSGASTSGGHRWFTAIGMRLSFADDGLTFGTSNTRGACIEFDTPVRRVIGFRNHSSLWVSVDDPEALVAALT